MDRLTHRQTDEWTDGHSTTACTLCFIKNVTVNLYQ